MNNSRSPGLLYSELESGSHPGLRGKVVAVLVGLILLAGCGGAPTVISYYVIDPVEMAPVGNLGNKSVQILDLKLPQYLERFQIARREAGNRITFNNNQQWGENLRKNLFRTMTRNLSSLLGTPDVGTAISRSFAAPDYSIRVSIESFEQGTDGRAQLAARYQISDGAGVVLETNQVDLKVDRRTGDRYSDMVGDLQQLFAELSRTIALSIHSLDGANAS